MKNNIYDLFQLEDKLKQIKTCKPKKLNEPKTNQKTKEKGLK